MSKKILFFIIVFIAAFLCLSLFAPMLSGQDEGTISDSFDDNSLEDYDHSQDVSVSEGVLKIDQGNFIFKNGAWEKQSFSLKFKMTDPGVLLVHYHFSDKGSYILSIFNEGSTTELILRREKSDQEGKDIGNTIAEGFKNDEWNDLKISFDGQKHEISLNDKSLLSITDDDPLTSGGIGFMVPGESSVEIDDLSISSTGTVAIEETAGEEATAEDEAPAVEASSEETAIEDNATLAESSASDSSWKDLVEKLFITGATPLDLQTFLINLILSALFAYILGLVYVYWGASLSNRRKFAANFILLTVTTTFIILVVRSSVALSLGLVGALSIVRFRAAIKEPEELAYLFLAIGLGIGLGDNQRLITTLAFAVAIVILGLLKLFSRSKADANMHLNITTFPPAKIGLKEVRSALAPYCPKVKLLRFDENDKLLELSFLVEFKKLDDLEQAREALQKLSEKIDITFLDNKGVW